MLHKYRFTDGQPGIPGWLTTDLVDRSSTEKQPAPTEFRIFRAGANPSDKGTFIFDEIAAASVMRAFAKKITPLTMDYEHMVAADPPIPAPASCSSWVPEVRNGELWATRCNWTTKAKTAIEDREYTRFSPLFRNDPKTKRILSIINCTLTNTEALDGVDTLVAASTTASGVVAMKTVNCKLCNKSLKVATESGEEGDEVMCTAHPVMLTALSALGLRGKGEHEVVEALTSLQSFQAQAVALTGKATAAEALGVLAAWKANDGQIAALTAQVEEQKTIKLRAEIDTLVKAAVDEGKIAPQGRAMTKIADDMLAKYLAFTGGKITDVVMTSLRAELGGLSKIVSTTATTQAEGGAIALTADEKMMAAQMGVSEDDMRKHKVEAAKAQTAAAAH